ncbi:hypothetical protein G3M48_008156 [Beauveria asiatica]|uniref:BTB domain-containing protein n=1 Tax=Beauveria asiatica TaxID=1069075 RepID=A0AAW0S404_9HYPO
MHPDRRALTKIASEDDDSSNKRSSDNTSSEEQPLSKTRKRRSNKLKPTAANIATEGTVSEPFQRMMEESFNSVILSDMTIFIKSFRFPAHSFVLAAQCGYFKDALTTGGLKEEAKKEFRFDHGQFHAYWRMLEYLYKGTYSDDPAAEINEPDDELPHRHIYVYATAKTFQIEGLQRLATERFKQSVEREKIGRKFVSCIQLVHKIMKIEDSMLGKEVMEIVSQNAKVLWKIRAFQRLVHHEKGFAANLVSKLLEE